MNRPDPGARAGERGAALLTVILMLVLVSALAVAFMSLVSGERAMSNNVHVAKGALYAADAGIRMAEQKLANDGKKRLDSLIAVYTGSGAVIKKPSLLFPKGAILTSATSPKFDASAVISITPADSVYAMSSQIYNYNYTITSTGKQGTLGSRTVQSTGVLRLSAGRGSFADYLMFTNKHTMPDGGEIWFTSSGYFEGRVHTNTQFRFQGKPSFEDLVTSVNQKAWYYNNKKPVEVDSDHYGTTDVPNFYGGFKRGQPNVTLPANDYNQQNAAIGLDPNNSTAPSNSTLRTQLGLSSGTSAPPNGVYVPNNGTAVTGGIYVQGNLDQGTMSVDGAGNQVYTLKQGSTTTTVTVNRAANTTSVKVGTGATTVYSGQLRGILYAKGTLSSVGGPSRSGSTVPPAIADQTQLLLCASGDIVIQKDLTYNDYNDGNSVLGLFSSGGKVRIGTSAPNDLNLNAFVMSAGSSGSFEVDDYNSGSPRGAVHLYGGMTTQYYGAFGTFDSNGKINHGYSRDFHFDNRGVIPPYFPTTNIYTANAPQARTLMWKEL
jgi:Tfp pilus assembly protein PilX